MAPRHALAVLHLTRDYPPPGRGGLSTAVHGLVRSAPPEMRQAVVSLERERRGSVAEPGTVPVLRVGPDVPVPEWIDWAAAQGPNVVHLHESLLWPAAEMLAARHRARLVYSVHVDHTALAARRRPPAGDATGAPSASQRAHAAALHGAAALICPSHQAAAALLAAAPASAAKVHVVPHGIDPVAPGPPRATGGPLVYVGRYDELKGTSDLFAVLPELLQPRPWLRAVIGGGLPASPRSERRWHERWLRLWPEEVRPRIELRGWLDAAEVSRLFTRAAVVAVPSHVESFGLVAMEAMAHAAPVVGSAVGAMADLIEDGSTGLSFAAGDRPGLARQLARLIDDPELARRLGQAGAERVRSLLTWQRTWHALCHVYRLS